MTDFASEEADGYCPIVSPTRWPPRTPAGVYDTIIIGAGLTGAAIARQLAERSGHTVLVADPAPTLENAPPLLRHLLDHPGIEVLLGVDPQTVRTMHSYRPAVFAGHDRALPGRIG